MGKTSLLLRCLLGAAREGHHVGMISLEVSEIELGLSLLSIEGGLDRSDLEDGKIPAAQVAGPASNLRELPGSIRFRCPARTPTAAVLVGMCNDLHEEQPLDLVAIDYIQRVATGATDSKVQALEALSLACCEFARVTGCHVFATAQLNRESEHRGKDSRPRMADLKGSGQFEQDAHNVILLHRGNKDRSPDQAGDYPDDRGCVNVAKQRNGPTGLSPVSWHGPTVTFSDWHRGSWS